MALGERHPLSDDLLDQGLRQYGQTLSRPGLENRILANLRLEKEKQMVWPWQRWAVPAAAVAVALTVVVVWRPTAKAPEIGHVLNSPRLVVPSPVSIRGSASPRQQLRASPRKRIAPGLALPRQPERFPSPRPLSSQEELLLAYVSRNPAQEVLATAREANSTEQVHVQELQVNPLHIDPMELTEEK
jgi:hypothetical protein